MIGILDYGAGSLKSVVDMFRFIDVEVEITHDAGQLMQAQTTVLPGVGSSGDVATSPRQSGLWQSALGLIAGGRPFLGIYLSMQLLFEENEKSLGVKGLSVLLGKIYRIPDGDDPEVPHIGWNSLTLDQTNDLLCRIQDQSYVYFVHSYYLHSPERRVISSRTQYGVTIDTLAQSENTFATQFHPEKSGQAGLQILENFVRMAEISREGKGNC